MKIVLTDNARAIAAQIDAFTPKMAKAIAASTDRENQLSIAWIVRTKLTNAGPKFLNVRTGRLRGSVRATKTTVSGMMIDSSIGTNVRYAGAHEFGFTGTVNVPQHSRRFGARYRVGSKLVSRSIAEGILSKGSRNTRTALKRREERKQGPVLVKAHSRKMHLPERAMFRTGISERAPQYSQAISAAIVTVWNEGRPS